MLDVAKYTLADLQDLKLTKYDPKDHEQDPGDRQPLYYYVLRIPPCRRRAKIADDLPPSPQRANQALNLPAIERVMIAHTSNPGGACGIFERGKNCPIPTPCNQTQTVSFPWELGKLAILSGTWKSLQESSTTPGFSANNNALWYLCAWHGVQQ